MPMKIKNSDMKEHLVEMMERLLDPDVMCNSSAIRNEIDKAEAMNGLVSTALKIQEVEQEEKRIQLDAVRLAKACGLKVDMPRVLGLEEKKDYAEF